MTADPVIFLDLDFIITDHHRRINLPLMLFMRLTLTPMDRANGRTGVVGFFLVAVYEDRVSLVLEVAAGWDHVIRRFVQSKTATALFHAQIKLTTIRFQSVLVWWRNLLHLDRVIDDLVLFLLQVSGRVRVMHRSLGGTTLGES